MAEREQVPAPTAESVVPETVQTEVVVEVKLTAPLPDPPVVARDADPPTRSAEIALIENAD